MKNLLKSRKKKNQNVPRTNVNGFRFELIERPGTVVIYFRRHDDGTCIFRHLQYHWSNGDELDIRSTDGYDGLTYKTRKIMANTIGRRVYWDYNMRIDAVSTKLDITPFGMMLIAEKFGYNESLTGYVADGELIVNSARPNVFAALSKDHWSRIDA